ncbi:MAG: hypothetical protein HY876_07090 [Coriobacteriales bacterium]|nr:hypothetical protein [Coriobacteriales bacterium]
MPDAGALRFSPDADTEKIVAAALTDATLLEEIVDALAGEDRRGRQAAARAVHGIAIHDPALLKPYAPELADALHRPESQTRWEVLGAFEKLVPLDARCVDKALDGAESALHDEESGVVRLAAFRLLAAYGATTATRSERVWPLLDEAVRVYHGDAEFPAMLSGVYRLVNGNSSDEVKRSAAERMSFDADNAKGLVARRARRICDCAPRKRGKK